MASEMPAGEMPPLTEADLQMLNTVCAFVGGMASESFWDKPTRSTVDFLANLYMSNPLATKEEVTSALGWSSDSYDFINSNMGPNMNESAPMFSMMMSGMPNPESSDAIIPIFVIFTILATVVMGLRIWSRISLIGRIQSFDYVAIFAYAVIVGWGALAVSEKVGGGKYASLCGRSFSQIISSQKYYWIGMMIYPLVVLLVKISLLIFYHQLSSWKPLRIAVYVTAFISVGNALAAFFAWMFQANYVDNWNHTVDPTLNRKIDLLAMVLATGCINILTDLMIWLIPMPLVWKLQLYPRERIIAVFTFGLGGIACIASILRLITVNDFLYYGNNSITPINAWGMVELYLALICSSAPALRALVVKYKPKLLSYGSNGIISRKGSKESSNNSSSFGGEKNSFSVSSRGVPSPEP